MEYRFFRIRWQAEQAMTDILGDCLNSIGGGWKPVSLSATEDEVIVLAERKVEDGN